MAPMLEDEIMHDAEKMNSKVAGIARTGKQIYDFIEQLKRAKNAAPENLDNGLPFSFSGQITDLSYFNTNDILPKEVIDSIPDAELKEAVISNLELAEKQGLIDVDLNNGNITLTDSGREYINNPNFIRAANIDKARSAIRAMEIQHGGDATKGYFKRFIDGLLSSALSLVYMGLIYLAGSYWCKVLTMNNVGVDSPMDVLVWLSSAGPKVLVVLAMGFLILKPPLALRQLTGGS